MTASTGETVFAGPRDDPFFVDLGGIFDLGGVRSTFGSDPSNPANARDAVAGFNTHSLVIKVPIEMLQKDGQTAPDADDDSDDMDDGRNTILDPDFVIGVWASASRRRSSGRCPRTRPTRPPRSSGPTTSRSRAWACR